MDRLILKGACEHNLKGVDLSIPRDALICFTGVSGSGKSSLAYDTIYKEGQRRFLESLSAYARQFIGTMEKPKLEHIEGLSPTVAIDQKSVSRNPRSTVGTITEVWDFLRLLMARLGTPHCPTCGMAVEAFSAEQIVDGILASEKKGDPLLVLAPVVRQRKGSYRKELAEWRRQGYVRARIDGQVLRLDEEIQLGRYHKHDIELVVDRLKVDVERRQRLLDSIENALMVGEGLVATLCGKRDKQNFQLYSSLRACPEGHGAIPELEPRLFSFNSPQGACPECKGLGESRGVAADLLVAAPDKSIAEGALYCLNKKGFVHYSRYHLDHLDKVLRSEKGSVTMPFKKLKAGARRVLFEGSGEKIWNFEYRFEGRRGSVQGKDRKPWPGLLPLLQRIWEDYGVRSIQRFQEVQPCPACRGTRLQPAALSVTFQGRNVHELGSQTIQEAKAWARTSWQEIEGEGGRLEAVGREIFRELQERLNFLDKVGLDYLRLDRSAGTLSGGESQRIRLAAQVGSGLRGILYVLDEPSIGLHPRDNQRLLETLRELRDRGNTVCIVEHDEETMLASDYLVDVGPGAGVEGGEIVVAGTPAEVLAHEDSLTAAYLLGKKRIEIPAKRGAARHFLKLRGAQQHNLLDLDVDIPLERFVCVSGVSGSGKSSLIHHVLHKALARELNGADLVPGKHRKLTGLEHLDKVIEIDQSPIGRTPRSNPATYSKVWGEIRELFASLPESKVRGYAKGRFSFNVKGGRCEACEGAGVKQLEMQFLEAVEVPCEVCECKRFNRETLEILFKGRNIHDILEMDIREARTFFEHHPKIARILDVLDRIGLGYVRLGQTSTTLSGGEAQRVKLASELARPSQGRTLYILDEPSTGLHFEDVRKLLGALQELVDHGNSVLVIEHNLDILKCADWILDIGPEGGEGGGRLLASCPPEELVAVDGSHTGKALVQSFAKRKRKPKLKAPRKNGKKRDKDLIVTGARRHNLKSVNARFPAESLTVVTGLSGSGKTSLAFDTLFQEGQRRFVESLSTYARRFLGRLDRAPVDKIEGLLPAIAIDQKSSGRNPRSTVGTSTEILDYLRLLFARVGQPHCPEHGEALVRNSPSILSARISKEWKGRKGYVLAPVRIPAGILDEDLGDFFDERIQEWKEEGFVRYAVSGAGGLEERRLEQECPVSLLREGFYLVVDRISFGARSRSRLAEAFELAARWGKGLVAIAERGGSIEDYSLERSCTQCGFHLPLDLHPRFFSFNHWSGSCPSCQGLGTKMRVGLDRLIARPEKPLFHGALTRSLGPGLARILNPERSLAHTAQAMAQAHGFDLATTPFEKLNARQHSLVMEGSGDRVYEVKLSRSRGSSHREYALEERWEGLRPFLERRYASAESLSQQNGIAAVLQEEPCPTCEGSRLGPAVLGVRIAGAHIAELSRRTVESLLPFFAGLKLGKEEKLIAAEVLAEIQDRLRFLEEMGLGYLELDRRASTLSGGEAQRIRLAGQLGSRLTGTLYVLDEPTVGLHPRDTERLLENLEGLRDLGNTVVAVEHDEQVIRRADHLVDMGPGAGRKGGEVVFEGPPSRIRSARGATADWLNGRTSLEIPAERRKAKGQVKLAEVRVNNLHNLTVECPLGVLSVVTGVSGSGKSSLVMDALVPALKGEKGAWKIHGERRIEQMVVVNQEPLGSTPRSCAVTYTGIWAPIRELFAKTEDARRLGFAASRFLFNGEEGRCSHCEGRGEILIEMHFLADVLVLCDHCKGSRYNEGTLQVRYRDKTIADVLLMEAYQALEFFGAHRKVANVCRILVDVGLDYLQLGQGVHTLSGGEAQRLKLAAELCKQPRSGMLYILDEPTTGLHMEDVAKLLRVLDRLVDRGASVLVIEHNMDVARHADWIVDLGPEAGGAGGRVVVTGTPEKVARSRHSRTAPFLASR